MYSYLGAFEVLAGAPLGYRLCFHASGFATLPIQSIPPTIFHLSIGYIEVTLVSLPRLLLTPTKGSLPHLPHYMAHLSIFLPYFHQKPIKPSKKPPKGHKTLFSSKKYPKFLQKSKNLQKGRKNIK